MKIFVIIMILLGAATGLYFYQARDLENVNREKVRQACLDVHYKIPVPSKLVDDVEGLCSCQSNIDLSAPAETIKQQGRACMDQYAKNKLLERCRGFNARLQTANPKQLDCDCFYDQLMTLSIDAMMTPQGIKDLSPEEGQQVSREAVAACTN